MFRSPDLRSLPVALVAAIVLGAAACGGGGGGDDQSSGAPDGESAGAAGATTTTTAAEGGGTTTAVAPTTTAPTVDSGGGGTTTVPAGGTGDGCAETRSWGSGPSEAGPMAAEDVYRVRPGRHDCYDRVVFDVNGVVDGPDAVGFHVAYVEGDVQADGSGEPVPTDGDAALAVIVRAPALGYGTSGHQPGRLLAELGDDLVTTGQVAGWPGLREVTFAGSFEGQTTFAVGVDRQVPFRAGSFEADGYTHVYVDIAHPR